jgi:hypothetical protein
MSGRGTILARKMTALWGMDIHICVALSVEQSLKKSYQQTVIYKLGV